MSELTIDLGAESAPMLRVREKVPEVGRRMAGGDAVSCESRRR